MFGDIAAIYRASKKKVDINWWTEWICRPVAAALIYVLKDTRITPNQVSFLSVLLAAASAAMFVLLPTHLGLVAAVVVFEISFVLDCTDGQLSRIRGTSSALGHYLDFLMDELKAMLILAAVSVRLFLDPGDQQLIDAQLVAPIALAAMFCLGAGLSMTSFTRRSEYGAKPPTKDGQPAVMAVRSGFVGKLISLLEHAGRFVVHYPSYIWLCAAFNRMDIYFWAYAATNALYAAKTFASIALRLGRFSKPPSAADDEESPKR